MHIYIHLPFCLSHCIYCDFYVELKGTPDRRRLYLNALKTEIQFHLSQAKNINSIKTLYFGGGTPGLFSAEEIREIIDWIRRYTQIDTTAEITLEANPDGTTSPIGDYLAAGLNRLSVGIQSLQPNELKRLSRIHSREDALLFVETARQAGFTNISIDLMYAIPEQTSESWQKTLDEVVTLGIQHVSMYGLQVESNTRMEKLLAQGRLHIPPEDDNVDFYFQGIETLEKAGIQLYEVSNLALPGFESRHNLSYWNNHEFYGFGVSAHGYINQTRTENPANLEVYQNRPEAHETTHPVSQNEALENALIFGLRKLSGVNIFELEKQYGFSFESRYASRLAKYLKSGDLLFNGGILKLSRKAIPVSNAILCEFIET